MKFKNDAKRLNKLVNDQITLIDDFDNFSFDENSITKALLGYIRKKPVKSFSVENSSQVSSEKYSGSDYVFRINNRFISLQAKKITPDVSNGIGKVTTHKVKSLKQIEASINRMEIYNFDTILKDIVKDLFSIKYDQSSLQFIEIFYWAIKHQVYDVTPVTIYYVSPKYQRILNNPKFFDKNKNLIYVADSLDIYDIFEKEKKTDTIKLSKEDSKSKELSRILFPFHALNNLQVKPKNSFFDILVNQKGFFNFFNNRNNFRKRIKEMINELIESIESNEFSIELRGKIENEIPHSEEIKPSSFLDTFVEYKVFFPNMNHFGLVNYRGSANKLSLHINNDLKKNLLVHLRNNLEKFDQIENKNEEHYREIPGVLSVKINK